MIQTALTVFDLLSWEQLALRNFQILCFAVAFFSMQRAGIVNLALGEMAGLSALCCAFAGSWALPSGPLLSCAVALCVALSALILLGHILRLCLKRLQIPDILTSLFIFFLLRWVDQLTLNLFGVGQARATPSFDPESLPTLPYLGDLNPVVVGGYIMLVGGILALRFTRFSARTTVESLNERSILLQPNIRLIHRDSVRAVALGVGALLLVVISDVFYLHHNYRAGLYNPVSFVGVAAGLSVSPGRSGLWLLLTSASLAAADEVVTTWSSVSPFPPEAVSMVSGTILLLLAIAQGVIYERRRRTSIDRTPDQPIGKGG